MQLFISNSCFIVVFTWASILLFDLIWKLVVIIKIKITFFTTCILWIIYPTCYHLVTEYSLFHLSYYHLLLLVLNLNIYLFLFILFVNCFLKYRKLKLKSKGNKNCLKRNKVYFFFFFFFPFSNFLLKQIERVSGFEVAEESKLKQKWSKEFEKKRDS